MYVNQSCRSSPAPFTILKVKPSDDRSQVSCSWMKSFGLAEQITSLVREGVFRSDLIHVTQISWPPFETRCISVRSLPDDITLTTGRRFSIQ